MASFILGREFPRPSLTVFVALQTLDLLTTLIGLQLGANEGSMFIARLMSVGPFSALLICKIVAVVLVCLALRYHRPRLIVFLNYWTALVVTWNLVMIALAFVTLIK